MFTGLQGKKVLATGGTSGIGPAIAVRFAAEGAHVAINYRTHPEDAAETDELVHQALEQCIHEVTAHGVNHILVRADVSNEGVDDPEKAREVLQHIPMGRAGEAEEMAAVTAFRASDEAAYITGQTLYVDGGLTLYPDFRTAWSSE
jgi:NAD(P)-dependent dehydrogenase (short-subunit alcohol dehydrogenase family)